MSIAREGLLRILRGIAFGAVAAVVLLFVAGAIAMAMVEPDGEEGLAGRPEGTGMAMELGHFEAGMNWLTFLGGFLWGAGTPTSTLRRWAIPASRAAASVGVGLVVFVILYALDEDIYWDGSGDPNMRPWITIGLAALAAIATYIGRLLAGPGLQDGGRDAVDEGQPATP